MLGKKLIQRRLVPGTDLLPAGGLSRRSCPSGFP
jgi:hypothetical protein